MAEKSRFYGDFLVNIKSTDFGLIPITTMTILGHNYSHNKSAKPMLT